MKLKNENKRIIGIEKYDAKIIISGDVLEVYFYDETLKRKIVEEVEGIETQEKEEKEPSLPDENYKRSLQSAKRAQKKMERLINANIGCWKQKEKFITLTFSEYKTREQVLKCFDRFKRRLKRAVHDEFEYIAVIERGTKGTKRLHMHCIFFNLPYVKNSVFRKIWKYGNVKINAVKNHEDLAGYVTKYIEKTLMDGNYIPKGKRFYTTSQDLKKPIEYIMNALDAVIAVKEYEEMYPDRMPLIDHCCDFLHTGPIRYIKVAEPKQAYIPKKKNKNEN